MRRLISVLLLIFAGSLCAWGQGATYPGTPIALTRGGFPASGATVTVCSGKVTVTLTATPPCSPYATIYSDPALITPITQPGFISDGLGNYPFFATPGNTYTIVLTGSGLTGYSTYWNAPIIASGTNTFSAQQTFSAGVLLSDGAISSPAYSWINATNSGWYRAGANDFRFSVAGVDQLKLNASGINSPSISTPTITGPMSGTRIPLVPFATGSAGSAIANTVTETASYTPDTTHIPAGTITAAGQILKAAYSGTYSTTATPTLRSRFRLDTAGGTVIADSTALTTSNNASGLGVGLNVSCVFSAVGVGGSAMCSGTIGLGGINVFQLSPVTLAFDTTVAHDFVFTETWGTANASNTTTGQSLVIERPN